MIRHWYYLLRVIALYEGRSADRKESQRRYTGRGNVLEKIPECTRLVSDCVILFRGCGMKRSLNPVWYSAIANEGKIILVLWVTRMDGTMPEWTDDRYSICAFLIDVKHWMLKA